MATGMPFYNNEEHEILSARIGVFNQILLSMAGVPGAMEKAGRTYTHDFFTGHVVTDSDDVAYVDLAPLSSCLKNVSKIHSAECSRLAGAIFSYLENAAIIFPESRWAKKVNDEIEVRLKQVVAIQKDLQMSKTVFASDVPREDSKNFHKQREEELFHRLEKFIEFQQYRTEGVLGNFTSELAPVFNLAGRQVALAQVTQQYARATTEVIEASVQFLLGMSIMPDVYKTPMFGRIRDMARHLVISANEALEDGARLSRESYAGLEINRPLFRSAQSCGLTRQSPGSHQP